MKERYAAVSTVGLYEQPNDWTCGPFALKHALVTLGQLADEAAISSVAHPHWWRGTDEVKLARAARAFGCDLPLVRRECPHQAHTALVRYLRHRLPVILCVDDWGHWITVVRHEEGRFVVIDSKTSPVLKVLSWPQLRNRWQYREETEDYAADPIFDLHPLRPRFRASIKAQFSVERAHFLRRQENADLATHWDEYLADLLEICRPRTAGARSTGDRILMSHFLAERHEMLTNRLAYWHGELGRERIQRVLRNFRFVADTYALAIPTAEVELALADICMLLGMWASAEGGIDDMYGSYQDA